MLPLAFEEALDGAVAGEVATVGAVVENAVFFLLEFAAVEIAKEEVAPEVETGGGEGVGFAFGVWVVGGFGREIFLVDFFALTHDGEGFETEAG